ncbi:MAG TPA: LamG-like jellyroll fold domain-containing protein, partial [Herpetosiphonaceae bacterium]
EWLELTTVGPAVANGAWSHVAASFDGVNFNIYVNGELIITSDGYQGRVPAPASGLLIGGADSRWRGALDEVRVYGRALPPAEMALLASRASASSWQNAALSRSTSLASAWSYALPADTEGYYLLHARASDDAANVGEPTTAWRGIIDTKAPVITATAALYGSAPVSRTVYTIATTDRFLDVDRISQPCAGASLALSYGEDPDQATGATVTCAVSGWVQGPIPVKACDTAGHCSSVAIVPQTAADPSMIAIQSPAGGASFPVGATVPVRGAGYDPQGIQAIRLFANQALIASFTDNPGATERAWQTGWQPTSTGTYTLTAAMTDGQGAVIEDTIVVAVGAANYQLSVARAGTGSGRVTSPAGIDCGSDCSESLAYGTQATLTAAPSAGSTFTRWGGACAGTQTTCSVTLSQSRAVTATFTLNTYSLTVAKTGAGSGAVTSDAGGIDCGAVCQQSFGHGAVVVLTATPAAGSTFAGWGGACAGAQATCSVTMTQVRSVTASFSRNAYALSVAVGGTGAGTVTSTPGGILCDASGGDCEETLDHGTEVALLAEAAPGSSFAGWVGGGCPENDPTATTCVVTMDQAHTVTANFTANLRSLHVALAGSGSGTVTSDPAGIACGAGQTDCDEELAEDAQVTLTATPAVGSTFAGWSGGGCPENDPTATTCVVTMDQAHTVTASFTAILYTLHVAVEGGGSGTVSGDGIACGAGQTDCDEQIAHGAQIMLTATPAPGSTFIGWSGGGCPANNPNANICTVTMGQPHNVTAFFSRNRFALAVTVAGDGSGTVSGDGIACGAGQTDCDEEIAEGAQVTLTATPAAGSTFAGWVGGGCPENNPTATTCVITMDQAHAVTANFAAGMAVLTVTLGGNGGGLVTSDQGGLNCGAICSVSIQLGTTTTLTAAADAGSIFAGWSGGGCPENNPAATTCTLTMSQSRTVTATFVRRYKAYLPVVRR